MGQRRLGDVQTDDMSKRPQQNRQSDQTTQF